MSHEKGATAPVSPRPMAKVFQNMYCHSECALRTACRFDTRGTATAAIGSANQIGSYQKKEVCPTCGTCPTCGSPRSVPKGDLVPAARKYRPVYGTGDSLGEPGIICVPEDGVSCGSPRQEPPRYTGGVKTRTPDGSSSPLA